MENSQETKMIDEAIFAPMAVAAFVPQNGLLAWYDFGNPASYAYSSHIDSNSYNYVVSISPPHENPINGLVYQNLGYSTDCGGYVIFPNNVFNYAGIYSNVNANIDQVPYNTSDTLSYTVIMVCRPYKNNVNLASDLGQVAGFNAGWHHQLMGINSSNKLVGTSWLSGVGLNNTITSSMNVKLGQWNMFSSTYYNPSRNNSTVGTLSVYVDDQLGATSSIVKRSSAPLTSGFGQYIGFCNYEGTCAVCPPNQFYGDVMATLWFNRALTSTEIAGIYAYYSPRFTQTTTPAPVVAGKGYIIGGQGGGTIYRIIDQVVFNTNIVSATSSLTPYAVTNMGAFSAQTAGYVCGGNVGGVATKNIMKILLSTGGASTLTSACLSIERQVTAGLYSKDYNVGYMIGGGNASGGPLANCDKFMVSTEISGNLPVGIGHGISYAESVSTSDRGYVAGGVAATDLDSNPGLVNINTKFYSVQYATDLVNLTNLEMIFRRFDFSSFYNNLYGYFLTGYNNLSWMNDCEKITFETEVVSTVGSAVLPYPCGNGFGMQSSDSGYVAASYDSNLRNWVFVMPFATEVTSLLSTGSTVVRDRSVCCTPAVF
jgi:hypothetical protein